MDQEEENYAIYFCTTCFTKAPVGALPLGNNQEVRVCLNCRSIIDSSEKPVLHVSEYALYKHGWSKLKIAKYVKDLEERIDNEKN